MDITIIKRVALPTLPNFLTIVSRDEGETKVSVGALTDDELRKLGAEWTEALVRHAQGKRPEAQR